MVKITFSELFSFKVGISFSKKVGFIYFNRRPLKMMKNAFYFLIKDLFRSQDILIFVPTFLVIQGISLVRKLRLISKFVTLQTGQQLITVIILPNISRIKGNQTMKFGQSIEYNDWESSLRHFYEKSKLHLSLDHQSEML